MEQKEVIPPHMAILAVVVTFILLLFVGAAFFIFLDYGVAMVLSELLIIVVPLGYMLYRKVDIRSYIGLDTKPLKFLLGIVFGISIFFFDILVSFTLVSIFGTSAAVEEANSAIMEVSASPRGLLLVIIALSLAGICEEFTFRGFLQTSINNKYSTGTALIVSSLAFGFFHFDPQAVYTISAFLIGLLLGYIYHRWHSYVMSAVTHATVNLITLAIMLLFV
jgi:membrane protease YdiL (CAAX protease family)